MHLKMYAKHQPFCAGLIVFKVLNSSECEFSLSWHSSVWMEKKPRSSTEDETHLKVVQT